MSSDPSLVSLIPDMTGEGTQENLLQEGTAVVKEDMSDATKFAAFFAATTAGAC